MSIEAAQQKATLRQKMRALAASATHQATDSDLLCTRLEEQDLWRKANQILFFVPRADEPDIWPLVEKALLLRKTVAFPRKEEGDHYVAASVADPGTQMVAGPFGIREPSVAMSIVPFDRLDLTLVPGLAFTLDGGRLGRGKGYYDRLLAKISGKTCGVAFDWQILSDLPMELHDIRLTYVMTPHRWSPASKLSSF